MRRFLIFMVLLLPALIHAEADVSLLIQAAEGGISEAQYDLAVLYERGAGGVKQSATKARQWYEAAAKNGHTGAKAWLSADAKKLEDAKAEKAKRTADDARQREEVAAREKVQQLFSEMITIGSVFKIGKYEVTQEQWKAVMRSNPSHFSNCGDTCPVENVSWDDVQTFLHKLNQLVGKRYRLPTDKEWKRACGMEENYCGGNEPRLVAWYSGNSNGKTHPVGRKQANANGLHDMSGNVWELTSGCLRGDCSRRVNLGGSWSSSPTILNPSASISHIATGGRTDDLGFRLAEDL